MIHIATDFLPHNSASYGFHFVEQDKSSQKVVGYSCDVHSIIEPVNMSYQVSCYWDSQDAQLDKRPMVTFLLW